tara:strand:- start:23 stop:295 length:273 start_codon:yes stop_codon:yes gene_type:complete
MGLVEKMIATAFYKGYSLSFDYTKYDDYDNATTERRRLISISCIKYNDDDEVLVCGCIDSDEYLNYRTFFLDNMSDIQVFKKIDIAELDS